MNARLSKVAAVLYWVTPWIACLALYRYGLRTWFQADDFAWLNHATEFYNFPDFLRAMFAPMAQGTIRPWSERAFFMAFYALFGLDAVPYRIFVFLTQFADLALLMAVARRLTGSRAVGLAAALLWLSNISLAKVMAWTSLYNESMCAFFLLAAFCFLLRFLESGRRRDWILQWVMFLLGFGALELNAVYPLLAAGYTWLCARKHFRRTLPLFIPSLIFFGIHRAVAPPAEGVYTMHFGASMWTALRTYWEWSLGPAFLATVVTVPKWAARIGTAALSAALLGMVAWSARRRQWLPLFLLFWFLVLIAPVLPLRQHISEYYPFLPTLGLAILGGWGLAAAWRSSAGWKILSGMLVCLYAASSIPCAWLSTRWMYQRGRDTRKVVLGVARAHELHPDQVILLDRVDDLLFWSTIRDGPFTLVGTRNVYLTPGTEKAIVPRPLLGDVNEFVLPPGVTYYAVQHNLAVVYDVKPDRLRNITNVYAATMPLDWDGVMPARVDAANPAAAYLLGPSWHEIEGNHRWMPKRATLAMAGPTSPGEKLHLEGMTPAEERGPVMTISVNGLKLPPRALDPASYFIVDLPLPPQVTGKPRMEVTIEADRAVVPPADGRELALTFGIVALR